MKYRIITLFSVMMILLNSCSKKESSSTSDNTMKFSVNGIADLKMAANESGSLALEVKHNSGQQENVTLSATGFPADVSHNFSSFSGTPSFTSVLTVEGDYAVTGTYPITINANSASGVSNSYNFNLIIEAANDCAAKVAGVYNGTENCGGSPTYMQVKVTKDPNNPKGGVVISQLMSKDILAVLDCKSNTLTIPMMVVQDGVYYYEIVGSGTFVAPNSLSFTLTAKNRTVNGQPVPEGSCTYTFVR